MNLAAIAQQLKSAFGFVTVKRDLVTEVNTISLPGGSKIQPGRTHGKNYGLVTVPCTRVESTYAVNASYGSNFQQVFWMPDCAGTYRFIFANGGSAAYTVAKAAIRPVLSSADFNVSGADYTTLGSLTFSGSATGSVPARPSAGGKRLGLVRSDWIERPPSARTDNFSGYLMAVRTHIAAGAGTITITGAASNDVTNWASRGDGKYYVARAQDGNVTTQNMVMTPAAFTSTTNVGYGPVIGVEFMANGRVFTIGFPGDSIDSGAGATYYGEGFGRLACDQLASELGVPVCFASLAWGGAQQAEYRDVLIAWLTLGIKPDLICLPVGSPNNQTIWDTSAINNSRSALGRMKAACVEAGIPYMTHTITPATYAAKAYGATDTARINLNTAALAAGNCADAATPINGTVEAHGQMEPLPAYINSSDGLHPTDMGHAAIAPGIAATARKFLVGGDLF